MAGPVAPGQLRRGRPGGHARRVRHATEQDLDQLEALLRELRKVAELRERKRGYFSRGGRAFLHFHEDGGGFYADVRLGTDFERMRVTSPAEQAELVARVRAAVSSADPNPA
jgi:hypothetical protein